MKIGQKQRQQLSPSQRGRTLLVVDDDSATRLLCTKALDQFTVSHAANGTEALHQIRNAHFDVILSDIMMPGLDGLELLQEVKAHDPEQAVVLMTAYSQKEIILRALKAGADDFIGKPLNLLQLRTLIDKVVEKQRLRCELSDLRRLDRLKNQFLGLISHKLKTPATAISLFIQNLNAASIDPEDEGFQQILKMIQSESRHLEHLIEDLLYFGDIITRQQTVQIEKIDPNKTLSRVLEQLREPIEQKQLTITSTLCSANCSVFADNERLNFSLHALLDNAIKFTPPGGSIRVDSAQQETTVQIEVQDTGPGIPAEEKERVFDKFYQIDPAGSGQVRGFGLGLFYAREFIRAADGELSLESAPGFGTQATISLQRCS
ncbi:MAG: hybrid sensor histidine kinase/response regulator [Desulfuromonas sp.]|nr:MAG: hybrid sensor histidine kinase/response regulator [Desulfuromonas sp.]